MINEEDLMLNLLSDNPIFVGDLPINKVSLETIANFGFSLYLTILSILTINQSSIDNILIQSQKNEYGIVEKEKEIPTIYPFQFLLISSIQDVDTFNKIKSLLSLICNVPEEDIRVDLKNEFFIIGKYRLDKNNFDEFQRIVKIRNGILDIKEAEENPSNEYARRLLARRKMLREKVAKQKRKENGVSIADLVSVLAERTGLSLNQVMQYDLYQLNNQIKRVQMYDTYSINIQALMNGAKSEDIDLKHFIRPTDGEEN